jgi:hypothetical protein
VSFEERHRPGARGTTEVQQVAERERLQSRNQVGRDRVGDLVHRPDERGEVGLGAAHAGLILDRAARLNGPGQPAPAAQTASLVADHAQRTAGARFGEHLRDRGGNHVCVPALGQQPHRRQRVQQDGGGSPIALDPIRKIRRAHRPVVQTGEHVQFRRGDQNAGRVIPPHHLQEGVGRSLVAHGPFPSAGVTRAQ